MAKIVKGIETDKWLPPQWRKSTFPIFRQPAKSGDDVIGAAFLLLHEKIPYIVTAKHVIQEENPVILFANKERTIIGMEFASFQRAGFDWIDHPAGLDITAIPFLPPIPFVKQLDVIAVAEESWVTQPKLKICDTIVHLGYPEKAHANYLDGKPAPFPIGMPGLIMDVKAPHIIMKTAGAHGASGGPVFHKTNGLPKVIGIVTTATMKGKPTRVDQSEYLYETKALMISLIKDIFELEEMRVQIES